MVCVRKWFVLLGVIAMVCVRERSPFHSSVNMKTTEFYFLSEVNFIILKLQTNERKGAWMSSVLGCFL